MPRLTSSPRTEGLAFRHRPNPIGCKHTKLPDPCPPRGVAMDRGLGYASVRKAPFPTRLAMRGGQVRVTRPEFAGTVGAMREWLDRHSRPLVRFETTAD